MWKKSKKRKTQTQNSNKVLTNSTSFLKISRSPNLVISLKIPWIVLPFLFFLILKISWNLNFFHFSKNHEIPWIPNLSSSSPYSQKPEIPLLHLNDCMHLNELRLENEVIQSFLQLFYSTCCNMETLKDIMISYMKQPYPLK